mgnify:CR=1 FL=1
MKLYIVYVLVFLAAATLIVNNEAKSNEDQLVEYISPGESVYVLEEWKSPGKYSPIMAFDGNSSTCFAEDTSDNRLNIMLRFRKEILIDEIRIINGFSKSEDLFQKNNRIRNLMLEFAIEKSEVYRSIGEEKFVLKDQMNFQSLKLAKSYQTNYVQVGSTGENPYKGMKYDDTCITEIEFYYKGKKIEINNTDQLQKDYLDRLNRDYRIVLEDRTYHFTPKNDRTHVIEFYKNGTIGYVESVYNPGEEVYFKKDKNFKLSKFLPYKYWKLENLHLYMKNEKDSEWKLMKFKFCRRQEYEGIAKFEFIIYKDINDKDGFELLDAINIHAEATGW